MYIRVRSRSEWTTIPRTSLHASARYSDGKWYWSVGSYPPANITYIKKFQQISDDWNRSSDRSAIRNVRAVTREFTPGDMLSRVDGTAIHAYSETAIGSSYLEATFLSSTDYSAPPPQGFGSTLQYEALEDISNGSPQSEALQGIPFLGEFRETVAMIRNPFSFLNGIQPALLRLLAKEKKKRRRKRGRRESEMTLADALRAIGLGPTSNGWLQYHYGWKPLMSDLEAFTRLATSASNSYSAYVSNQRGKGTLLRRTKRMSTVVTPGFVTPWSGIKSNVTTQHTARCITWYRYTPAGQTMSKAAFLATKMGLTGGQIAASAWELMPYSFVVDWFLPIGKALSSVSATPVNFDIVKQQYDYTAESQTDVLFLFPDKVVSDSVGAPPWKWSGSCGQYRQRVYERHGYPFLGSSDPSSSWFTTNRAVSALALIVQALKLPIPNRGKP